MRFFRVVVLCWLAVWASGFAFAETPGVVVKVWQSQDGLPGNVVRSVVQSSDGYLWVATAEGIARFDGFEFVLFEPEGDLRRFRLAFSRLFAIPGGDVLAATYQGGLFGVRDGQLFQILENARPRPPMVTQVVENASGEVFFKRGEETGKIHEDESVEFVAESGELQALFEEDRKRQEETGRVFEQGASPVLRDRSGAVWSAGASGELVVSRGKSNEVAVDFPQRGHAFGVNELMQDREGNVWVASPIHGLARVRHARVGGFPVGPIFCHTLRALADFTASPRGYCGPSGKYDPGDPEDDRTRIPAHRFRRR